MSYQNFNTADPNFDNEFDPGNLKIVLIIISTLAIGLFLICNK